MHISIAASALQSRVKVLEWMLQVEHGSCAATLGHPIGEIDIFFSNSNTIPTIIAELESSNLLIEK